MPTKKQHFVPRVYLKAWETTVETSQDPDKKFDGVYVFENSDVGEGNNRKSVLWKPHLYTINFKHSFICNSCPKVKKQFVEKIYNLLRTEAKIPIHGKLGYSIIKTKKSIEKHFFKINDWDFYYDNGNLAKKSAILRQIEALNCYLLEETFDDYFEKTWEMTYKVFVNAVKTGSPVGIGQSERIIPEDIAINMLSSFFVMLCRNPSFDAMGVYSQVKKNLLYPVFESICHSPEDDGEITDEEKVEGKEYADELMQGIWYSELYKMFYKNTGGFYHNVVKAALSGCQMILFEAYNGAGAFITSDNPAFEHKSVLEIENQNGMIFPLSPEYLVFFAKGSDGINYVDYRFADSETIKHFNRIIAQHKTDKLISIKKNLRDSF